MLQENVFLVVHAPMQVYIKHVVVYLQEALSLLIMRDIQLRVVNDISEIMLPQRSIIFFLGDKHPCFDRKKNCYYVYINLELLFRLSKFRRYYPRLSMQLDLAARYSPFSREARFTNWWIQKNYISFRAKLKCFDMVLEFYKPQAVILQKELSRTSLEVMWFPVNVSGNSEVPRSASERKWDVCVVGSESRRRRALYEKLTDAGVRLSPMRGIDLADAIVDSKLTLNVHVAPCKHFECPRIIQVLKMGGCLVTEECFGMNDVIPADCYVSSDYAGLVDTIQALLLDTEKRENIAKIGRKFIEEKYDDDCLAEWALIVKRIHSLAQSKWN